MKKRAPAATILLILTLFMAACGQGRVDSLTYAVYPNLPDTERYQEIIEERWAEIEPDIELVRAQWNCYTDAAPDGIDVVMFDAVTQDRLIDSGWIQTIDPDEVTKKEEICPFALEGLTADDRLYGIPTFLCGNFLIYDRDCEELAMAEHITDLEGMSEMLVVNSELPANRHQYVIEAIADTLGEANPSVDEGPKDCMRLIDQLAIEGHKHDDDTQVAMAYDSGIGQGYIGFSESMRLLGNRGSETRIKSVSFSDRENVLRLYVDAAAVVKGVEGRRYEKSLELMNVMADADVLATLSVSDGVPQYLMLARSTPYQELADRFPLYAQIEALAEDERNHVILTP